MISIPLITLHPVIYSQLISQIHAVNVWRLKNLAGILTVCWESAGSELPVILFIAESIGKDTDNVSTDDPKTEFDA